MKRRAWITSIVVGLLIIGGGLFMMSRQARVAPRTITLEPRDVVQDVSFTGHVRAKQSVDSSFEIAGQIQQRHV